MRDWASGRRGRRRRREERRHIKKEELFYGTVTVQARYAAQWCFFLGDEVVLLLNRYPDVHGFMLISAPHRGSQVIMRFLCVGLHTGTYEYKYSLLPCWFRADIARYLPPSSEKATPWSDSVYGSPLSSRYHPSWK